MALKLVQTPLMAYEQSVSTGIFAPVVERKLSWHTNAGDIGGEMEGYKALIRAHTNGPRPLTVVSNTYKVIPMYDLLVAVEDAIIKEVPGAHPSNVTIKDQMARYGAVCLREYVFKNIRADIGSRADVALRIIVINSYGLSSLRILGGAVDFFCTNGMVTGDYDSAYHRHTSGLTVSRVVENVRACIAAFKEGSVRWRSWVNTPVAHEEAMNLLRSIAASPRMFDRLLARYVQEAQDRGSNLWAVVSTLTHYATHGEVKQTDNDTVATTRIQRSLDVDRLLRSDMFREKEMALVGA